MEDNRENRHDESVYRMRHVLQAVLSKACEDHLGVALIQPGGSRYEQMKWQFLCTATRVEPRILRPLQ